MKSGSKQNTKFKMKLRGVAEILSGIYLKESPAGNIAYLQIKDLLMASPETTAARVEYTPKLENYLLKKGDLLFAGKGSTYYCGVYEWEAPAVPSTTLYSIRIKKDYLSPEYLSWYLNHPSTVAVVKTSQAGSGTPLIHKPTLENLEIIIPDIRTQQFVVQLSALQKKEEQLLRQIAIKRVEVMNQILINELNK